MNILFVCTGNTCRSSMAEALLKDMLKELDNKSYEINVSSAGIYATNDMGATPQAIIAMQSRGIDLTRHKARLLTKQMINDADLILTMTKRHKNTITHMTPNLEDKVYTLKEFVGLGDEKVLDIVDPFGHPEDKYKETAKEIEECLKKALKVLTINRNIVDM